MQIRKQLKHTMAAVATAALLTVGGLTSISRAAPRAGGEGTTLRQAGEKRHILIGCALMSYQLDNPKLAELVATQFDQITPENEMKPDQLEREKGHFTFEGGDKIVAFAKAHDMKVVGHNLCWHNQTPKWMFQAADGKPLPREEALANLKEHIDAVVKHYKGRVIGWDVVNEAISDSPNEYLRETPAKRAIGDDYLVKAFQFAHEADPDVQLYYNDYSNENPDKRDKTIKLIRDLKKAGVRIDAIGLQAHFATQYANSPKMMDEAIKLYTAEGVKCMLTELDVDVLPRRGGGADVTATEKGGMNPYTKGLPADAAQKQAEYYRQVMQGVMHHPGDVTRITFWGIHDGLSWLNDFPVRGRTNYALLFDRQLQTKPAYQAVLEELSK